MLTSLSMLNGAVTKRAVVPRPLHRPEDPKDRDPAVLTPRKVVPGQRLCHCGCWLPYARFCGHRPRERRP